MSTCSQRPQCSEDGPPNGEQSVQCKHELAEDEGSNGQNRFEGIAPVGGHPIEQ